MAWQLFFGDAEQAIDAVVALGIFDAAGANQRSVDRLCGRRERSLPCWVFFRFLCLSSLASRRMLRVTHDDAVLRGFLAVEYGAAGAAHR
jgi:hypothetical protein